MVATVDGASDETARTAPVRAGRVATAPSDAAHRDTAVTQRAVALTEDSRTQNARIFFERFPNGPPPLGLGRAVVDFIDWQRRSGRLSDVQGSRWWRCVNGVMCLHLETATLALDHDLGVDDAPARWVRFTRAGAPDAQRQLWAAHQASLRHGLAVAQSLLTLEMVAEQELIRIVLAVVESVAQHNTSTATDRLAAFTARHYPEHYPALGEDVDRLRIDLASVLEPADSLR